MLRPNGERLRKQDMNALVPNTRNQLMMFQHTPATPTLDGIAESVESPCKS
jgi:hypothetical protein